jgi:hypothetical protein
MQYIKNYKFFLENYNWKELERGDDVIKIVKPDECDFVVKLTQNFDSANIAQFISTETNNSFVANIKCVHKIKGKKQYFIVEELVEPLNDNEITKATAQILKLALKTSNKVPDAFKESKKGVLDLLYYLWENDIAIEHELAYSYFPIFIYLNRVLKLKEFDLNSKNMAKRKNKYILFDVTGSIKKQDIKEIIVSDKLKTLDDIFQWYIKNEIK